MLWKNVLEWLFSVILDIISIVIRSISCIVLEAYGLKQRAPLSLLENYISPSPKTLSWINVPQMVFKCKSSETWFFDLDYTCVTIFLSTL